MKNLQKFWTLISQNKLIIAFLVLSFIGFLDASFLTIEHYNGAFLKCRFLQGCETVLNSEYSKLMGIPVSLFGVFYYLSVFVGSLFYLDSQNERFLKHLCVYTLAGFFASLYLVYLQAFVIGAFCEYCILSATTSTLLFILGGIKFMKIKK